MNNTKKEYELELKYHCQTIGEIERDIDSNKHNIVMNEKEMVEALYYLRMSLRYKENPLYKNYKFKEYLKNRHLMSMGSYYLKVRAIFQYEEDTLKYGIGVIHDIIKKCDRS